MSSTLGRIYALATAVVVFFVAWALIAAKPWMTAKATPDKRLVALDQRQRRLRAESIAVRKLLARRWSHYKRALAGRERQIAYVRQLWVAHQAAVARAQAAAVRYTYVPASSGSTASSGGVRTTTSYRTVVVGSHGTGSAGTQPAAPASSPAPAAPAPAPQAPAPAAPAPAPPPAAPPPPPPPPVVSSPPATSTHSS